MIIAKRSVQPDLGDLLAHEVYPALFNRLDSAFPEFGWIRAGNHWTATSWPPNFPYPVGHENPSRLMVYPDRPYWIKVHGHAGVRFLDYVNGGQSPTGPDFPKAVRALCDLSGVSFPEREYSHEDMEKEVQKERRRSALDAVIAYCQEALRGKVGKAARDYLVEERGLTEAGIEGLGIGLYTSAAAVSYYLQKMGVEVADTALLWPKLEGYIVFPWADDNGLPLTLYGRWPGKPPQGSPKTIALPGEGTKASPLYFDRTRQAHHKDLVLVEGVLDAAVLQERGDSRVMACVAAQLSGLQVETLKRHRVSSVTICLDPDGGGERGTLSCIKSLHEAGIKAYVAPMLPDGMDPDQFVIKHGLDAWKDLIDRRVHALRYQAEALVRKHKGKEWTDAGVVDALDEAIALDSATTDPERLVELDRFFWPVVMEATGAGEEAIEGRRVAAREKRRQEREKLEYDRLLRTSHELLRQGEMGMTKELLREEVDRLRAEERILKADPVVSVAEELADHAQALERWRGEEFIGLTQKTLPSLDEATLGFRGLMLLAAGPNVGKTALAVQFGLDVVKNNKDACFLFLSLEMSRTDIVTRMKCRLAEMDWKTLVFGSSRGRGLSFGNVFFTQDEYTRLQSANLSLAELGDRIRVLDERNFPAPTVEKVIHQVKDLKARTETSRTFILVDYLQVWPIPPNEAKNLRTELDADKWRIGAMKTLRDALEGDAVMVISEARKPGGSATGAEWGGDLADVMGAARGTYTPDMVFLLNPLRDEDLFQPMGEEVPKGKEKMEEQAAEIRKILQGQGVSWNTLKIAKGRDGVLRVHQHLTFWFKQSRFEEGFIRRAEDEL